MVKPVEGTILSVARGIAKGTREVTKSERDFAQVLRTAIVSGEAALAKTPDQLPILKEANVVDAGGQGLLLFLKGCLEGLTGEIQLPQEKVPTEVKQLEVKGESFSIEYPYCTEFIVNPCKVRGAEARSALESWGESMIVAEGDGLLKVHIHTQRPGHVLDMAADWGTLHDIKVDNMVDQFNKNKHIQRPVKKNEWGVLAIVSGEGWNELMEGLHVEVMPGGQTMNPSVQEIMQAIDNGYAERYIVLPNNKNIILAAKQAKKVVGQQLEIVETINPAEGAAVAMAYDPQQPMETVLEKMKKRLHEVVSGGITRAVRDSQVDGVEIHCDDYMGLVPGSPVVIDSDLVVCVKKTMAAVIEKLSGAEIVTMYYGSDLTAEAAQAVLDELVMEHEDMEFEMYNGGQPLYPFFFTVE